MAAPDNTIVAADVAPAITIDHVNKLNTSIEKLQSIFAIPDMMQVPEGNQIKIYSMTQENTPDQPGEGEQIPLTEISREVARTIDMTLKKYRKVTTAEAIIKSGREVAVDMTDDKLIEGIQKSIKGQFFSAVKSGTGTATAGATLQEQMANNWAALEAYYEDMDCDPIHFVNPTTAAGYLAANNLTIITEFGMKFVESLLGTIVITTAVSANDVWSTAKQNLNGAYIPANAPALADFNLVSDATGFIGMKHTALDDYASIQTVALSDVVFYPEVLAGVIKGTVNPS